jgi:N-acetylmuramoyl-L-alanine amidase
MSKKVAYCAGHGGKGSTPGKRDPDGRYEWDYNDKVADAFAKELCSYEGVTLKRFDDSTGKTDVSLSKRTDGANEWGADVYISFHHNGLAGKWGDHTGVETHVYETKPEESVKLAKLVQPALAEAYGLRDRGVKYTNLHITRETNCTAILVEGGFMDSEIDIQKLRDDAVLADAGKAIAKAVASFLGLKKKPVKEPAAVKTDATVHKVTHGDTLWAISKQYDVPVADLKKFNNLKEDTIFIGQVLRLAPAGDSTGIKQVGMIEIVNLNNFTYVYERPSSASIVLDRAYRGATYPIAGSVVGWFEIIHKGKRAYVSSKYARLI